MNILQYSTKKTPQHETGKSRLLACACILCGLLFTINARAQTNGPLTLSSANTTGNYSSNASITLSAGFTSTGPFSATIQLIDCIPFTTSPTTGQNFVMATVPRLAGYTAAGQLSGQGTCQVMQTVQYFDGIGRPLQTVQVKGSPFGNDLVQPIAYDPFGRETTKYLPYALTANAASDGSYKANALTAGAGQAAFYTSPPAGVAAIPTPQSVSALEASPLSRLTEQGAPGNPWQLSASGISGSGHTIKTLYQTDDGTIYWARQYGVNIDGSGNRTLVFLQTYSPNQLGVTVTEDENWTGLIDTRLNTTETYTDKLGHVVLKRTYNYTTAIQVLSTYYVYDDLGNLTYVLPPLSGADAAAGITSAGNQTTLNNLCYQYGYDSRNRLTSKQIPGKGVEYMVYNRLDQPVLSQDANQRAGNQWVVTKYDAQGRVIVTGLWNAGAVIPLATLQSSIYAAAQWDARDYTNNIAANPTGYVISSYPQLSKALSINFYDDYTFTGQPAAFTAPAGASVNTSGLLTASKTAVLNTINNNTPDMLWAVHYYDVLGRNIQTYQQHYLGGMLNSNNYDAVTTTYDFTNAPTTVTRQHFTAASTTVPLLTATNTYLYDHMGRKLKTWEQLKNGSLTADTKKLVSQVAYNELGQVMTKNLQSTDSVTFLQNIAYTYNERGWLLQSSTPLFEMQLQYNTSTITGISPVALYNGNIASQSWGTSAAPNSKSFTYVYDKLNRLSSGSATDKNNESGITYDLGGNIGTLNRYHANVLTDKLAYTYTAGANHTDQLQTVANTGASNTDIGLGTTSYLYDGNGNMLSAVNTADNIHNKSFTYNLLNLPIVATVPNGTATYTYDADGNKLRKVSVISGVTKTTDYIGGIEYDNSTTAIGFIQTEEGKAVPNGTTAYDYTYYLSDNLGNTRITFDTKTGAAVIEQQDDYYPFGLEINRSVLSPKNEYLYNKKELQEEFTEYDYGARFYDPVIGRWSVIDGKAELYFSITPYAYAANTPVNAIDRDGRLVIFIAGQNSGDGSGPSYWAGFDKAVQKHFNDYNDNYTDHYVSDVASYQKGAVNGALYLDGGLGGWSNTFWHWGTTPFNLNVDDRLAAGYAHEGVDIYDLINSLKRTNGVITESIKVVAHSLGAAYARGLIAAIVEYAKAHPEECAGLSITEYDFAAFQQNELPAPSEGVTLYQFDNKGDDVVDGIVGSVNNSHHAHEKGRDEKGSKDDVNPNGGHSITDFLKAVSTLAPGKYKYVNGEFIPTE